MLGRPMSPLPQPLPGPPFRPRGLVALGLLAVILPAALAAWATLKAREAMVAQIKDTRLILARGLASKVQQSLDVAVRTARSAARRSEMGDTARQRAGLEGVYTALPVFRRLALLDPSGRLWALHPPAPEMAGPPLLASAPEPAPFSSDGDDTLMIVREPLDPGLGMQGVLVAEISLKKALSGIEELRFGETGAATILDGEGRVLASSDPSQRARVLPSGEILELVRQWKEGAREHFAPISQREEISVLSLVEGYPLAVLLSQARAEAFAPISRLLPGLALGFAALLVLGLVIAVGLSRDFADYEARLRSLALSDELTGLHTRRCFLALAQEHLELARRARQPFLVARLDLDGLKAINDTRGHAEGDAALVATADVLRQTFRGADILARVGDDQFAVLVAEAADGAERVIAGRLAANVEEHNLRMGDRSASLSLSLGVASYDPDSLSSLVELLASAEQALHEHRAGRRFGQALPAGAA